MPSTPKTVAPAELCTRPDNLCATTTTSSPRQVELIAATSHAKHLAWWDRNDLYYETHLFGAAPRFREHTRTVVETTTVGLGASARNVRNLVDYPDFTDAHDAFLTSSPSTDTIVAWLAAYHHSTTTQLIAATGYSANTVRETLKKMWKAGLVERAEFNPGRRWNVNAPHIWRLHDAAPLTKWVRRLDNNRWLNITAGFKVGAGPNHVRHNLLVTELALRLAECRPDLQAIFGEPLACPDMLLPEANTTGFRGDLVAVRPDGLRIVIELVQASRDHELVSKMTRWAQLLAPTADSRPAAWHDHGTVVIFLASSTPGTANRNTLTALRRAHTRAITAANLGIIGNDDNPRVTATKFMIGIADAEDWFPRHARPSTDFTTLTAAVPAQGTWRRIAFGAPGTGGVAFNPTDPAPWTSPATTSQQLLAVPHDLHHS